VIVKPKPRIDEQSESELSLCDEYGEPVSPFLRGSKINPTNEKHSTKVDNQAKIISEADDLGYK
jgi:hypothetical protein